MKIKQEYADYLENILESEKIRTIYQPIVNFKDCSILGYEALSKIKSSKAPITLSELFKIARKNDKLWELEELCRKIALKGAVGKPEGSYLFLNVDPNIILDKNFQSGMTAEILSHYGLKPDDIVFNIAERNYVKDENTYQMVMFHYINQNYKISLDNFGSEHAGLKRVCYTKPQFVKLSEDLIRGIDADPLRQNLVHFLADFCNRSDITLIASGIESLEELGALISCDVRFGQGFCLGIPDSSFSGLGENICYEIKYYENLYSDKNKIFDHKHRMNQTAEIRCREALLSAARQVEAIEKQREQALQSDAAKTVFLSQMSHDIRTPMNVIVGMTEIARRNKENPEKVEDCLNKIEKSGKHLQNLINDILDVSAIESGKISLNEEIGNINELAGSLNDLVNGMTTSRKLEYSCEVTDISYVYLKLDVLRYTQILQNLLSNAVKYTDDGGRIKLKIWEEKMDDRGNAGQEDKKVTLCAMVSDNGIGMSEAFMSEMFESFSREFSQRNRNVQGTGLGLSIVKQLVDLMSGTIDVESHLGEGTTFTIKCELNAADESEMVKDHYEKRNVEDLRGKTLLVAEDSALNYEILHELLKDYGINMLHGKNGEEAVAIYKERKDDIDCILMDMMMPVRDGIEATMDIRALPDGSGAEIPIIALTANAFRDDIDKCKGAGMNDFVSKPVKIDRLVELILRYI